MTSPEDQFWKDWQSGQEGTLGGDHRRMSEGRASWQKNSGGGGGAGCLIILGLLPTLGLLGGALSMLA